VELRATLTLRSDAEGRGRGRGRQRRRRSVFDSLAQFVFGLLAGTNERTFRGRSRLTRRIRKRTLSAFTGEWLPVGTRIPSAARSHANNARTYVRGDRATPARVRRSPLRGGRMGSIKSHGNHSRLSRAVRKRRRGETDVRPHTDNSTECSVEFMRFNPLRNPGEAACSPFLPPSAILPPYIAT